MLTAISSGLKTLVTTNYIRLGGTGVPWSTPRLRDVVYSDLIHDAKHAGVKVTPERAMRYIPFFAAVKAISEDIASLPLNVYVRGSRSHDEDHPVDALLDEQSNPYMSAMTFRETLQAHVLTWGNGYAEIEYADDASILALWPLRPDRMQVLVEDDELVYRYAVRDGRTIDLPRRKVLHIHGLGYDGFVGYSIIDIARRTLALALAAQSYGEDWFEKGGLPQAVLKHPKTLTDQARANLRTSVDGGALSRRDRVAIIEEGMDLAVLGIPAKDSEFLATGADVEHLMAVLFRMPPHMLSNVDRSTSWGTGIEQLGISYVRHTLRSWLTRWEKDGKRQLMRDEPRYLRHTIDAFLRGDAQARWQAYKDGFDRGVWSIDDILAMEDRDPLPDGQGARHFVPLNMVPLDQVGEMTLEQRLSALTGLIRSGVPQDEAERLAAAKATDEAKAAAMREMLEASRTDLVEAVKAISERPVHVENPTTFEPGAIQVTPTFGEGAVSVPVTIAEGAVQAPVTVNVEPSRNGHVRKTVERDADGRIAQVIEEPV